MTQPIDPQLQAVIEEFEARGVPPWHSLSVPAARRMEDELFSAGDGPEMQTVRDLAIPGPGGEIPVRVYRPDAPDPATLVFYHGGGWVLGTLDSADDICRNLAARSGCLVISVDYRLAPEHPFPAAVDDAYAALKWASEYADSFGGDTDRLGVAGTSAGGNLAGSTALRARGDDISLDGQFLLYPMVDAREVPSGGKQTDESLLSSRDVAWFFDQYLRSQVDAANPYVSLLAIEDPTGLPPATVLTGGFDILSAQGQAYAEMLSEGGVPTETHQYPSLAHGFLSLAGRVDRADEAFDDLTESIRNSLQ